MTRTPILLVLAAAACSESPARGIPDPAPLPEYRPRPRGTEVTDTSAFGFRVDRPMTIAELRRELGRDTDLVREVERGRGRFELGLLGYHGHDISFVFASEDSPFLWFETYYQDDLCFGAVCVPMPLAEVPGVADLTCTGAASGQGFHAYWTCPVAGTPVLLWLDDPAKTDYEVGPMNGLHLAATGAVVRGFIWLTPGATWSFEHYDEGDR